MTLLLAIDYHEDVGQEVVVADTLRHRSAMNRYLLRLRMERQWNKPYCASPIRKARWACHSESWKNRFKQRVLEL